MILKQIILLRIILATDMGNHNLILNKFKSILDEFDIKNPEHRIQVQYLIYKLKCFSKN